LLKLSSKPAVRVRLELPLRVPPEQLPVQEQQGKAVPLVLAQQQSLELQLVWRPSQQLL
jgi:hypothetical protein